MTTEAVIDTAALDAELAEKLDGFCAGFIGNGDDCGASWGHHHDRTGLYTWSHEYVPAAYSTTGDGMLLVLEKVRGDLCCDVDILAREGEWLVNLTDGVFRWHGLDRSLPTAVALAALSALEAA